MSFGGFSRGRGVCFDWQKGICNRGESCRFAHGEEGDAADAAPSGGFGGGGGGGHFGSRGVCFDWQKGNCNRGDSCRFEHSGDGGGDGGQASGDRGFGGFSRSRGRGVCFDWQKGNCNRGDSCRFSHGDDGGDGGGDNGGYRSGFGGGGGGGGGFSRRGRGVCFDWQKGQCNRGESCRFEHSDPGADQETGADGLPNTCVPCPEEPANDSGFGRSRGRGVCFDWQKGVCNRGDSCRFEHSGPGGSGGGGGGFTRRPRGVCFDWQKGVCNRGDSCRFAHEEPEAAPEEDANAGDWAEDAPAEDAGDGEPAKEWEAPAEEGDENKAENNGGWGQPKTADKEAADVEQITTGLQNQAIY